MCAGLKTKDKKKVAEFATEHLSEAANAASTMKQRLSRNTAGNSVAMGCTALLKAKNNGKMEWFESQQWYKKAMNMCESLAGASPMTLQKRFQDEKGLFIKG